MDETDNDAFCENLFSAIPLLHDQLIKPFESLFRRGLSPMQFYTLGYLQRSGCAAMTELAGYFCIPKQQMTKIVSRLVELGAVERQSAPNDRRLIRICLTEQGRAYLKSYRNILTEYLRAALSDLSAGEKAELIQSVRSLHKILPRLSVQSQAEAPQLDIPSFGNRQDGAGIHSNERKERMETT